MFTAEDGNTSSDVTVGPTNEESRTWRWTAENSWEDNPLTESTVREKLTLLPGGIVPGTGEDERVEADEPLACLEDNTTFKILMSTRHDPIASAVYRQNIGTVEVDESRRERVARDIKAFPMNEYSGGGMS